MAVRAFNGSSDLINTATGALATGTFGTQAVIVKRGGTGNWHTFLALHNSGGSALTQFAYQDGNLTAWWIDGVTVTGPAAISTADWGLLVVRKATSTATPRFSLYNFSTDTWVHANASGTRPNWPAPGTGGTVRVEWEGFDRLNGRLAARAAWNSLPWAADASGDAALEAAGLEVSAANWLAASPSAMWLFNQAAVTDPVLDETGNGADQTSRTGTTVVNGDDPPGFSFDLTAGVTVEFAGQLPALQGSFAIDLTADVQLTGQLPALQGDFAVTVAAVDVQLTGQLPVIGGTFDISSTVNIQLAGQLPALQGSFAIDSTVEMQLAGQLPALGGSLNIAVAAIIVQLDGELLALQGGFTVELSTDVQLAGQLPALDGSFVLTITQDVDIQFDGQLPTLQGSFTIQSGELPPAPLDRTIDILLRDRDVAVERRERVVEVEPRPRTVLVGQNDRTMVVR